MADTGLPARRAALKLIEGVCTSGKLIPEMMGQLDHLNAADRARAQRLALQTLRHMDKCDRVLKPYLKKLPPEEVLNVLRLAVVELCEDKAAAHGVVNAGVTLTSKLPRVGHLKGMVNAILRKVASEGPEAWAKLPAARIPNWLRGPLMQAWGRKAIEAMERVAAHTPPLDITAKGALPNGGAALPTGSYRLSQFGQVTKLAGYTTGDWWVQDAAAALPARILAPQKGETIADLCAAPGGKTLQLAAAGAQVTAVDDNANRMERLSENLKRTGLNATTVVQDALTFEGQFDAVLLDAPCSATGTMRRHPDLPHAKDGSDFNALIALQGQMLRHAMTLVKPGGRLVYCTCSLLPDEGEVQIEELELGPDWRVDAEAVLVDGVDPDWRTVEGGLRTRPDYWADMGGMDGFYIACLRRSA